MRWNADFLLEKLKFRDGLIPVVAQDKDTRDVLMIGFMNRDALKITLETGYMHYWSRSRRRIWRKGEVSGHTQKVFEVRVNCEENSLLFLVEQKVAACHEGYRSCFYRKFEDSKYIIVERRIFDPREVYKDE
ncbi:phosphoribosyl-AMP cyclohydrolase [Candidatus Bathyarchaeota archaeon ex4484_205]|nr:MAG: phosphoribosyl-AMP cyclohydrolase [Candidatus Bathyarchaeota archaeon ex4484_205]RLG67869.1 MAG: phosphoribosyl-AMP cyclohydrolase [archaeon]